MNNSMIALRFTVFLLYISILLTGCHSYFEVSKKDYVNLDKMNDIKIVYKDGKELIVEKDDTTNAKIIEDSIVVYQGTNTKTIAKSDVEKIRESRFDFGRTLSLVVGTVVGFLLTVSLFIWAMGGVNLAG